MLEKIVMERRGKEVTLDGMRTEIPGDVSILSIFTTNSFIPNGHYHEDGFIYVNKEPIKKWFKKINDVTIWFPILSNIHKLQARFYRVKKAYKKYLKDTYLTAFNKLRSVKKAHVLNDQGWMVFTASKEGISWNWMSGIPENPVNVEIGTEYHKAEQRLYQLGSRVHKFRTTMEYALEKRLFNVKGENGDVLQLKVGKKIYWYQYFKYSWKQFVSPEDKIKKIEI